MKWRWEPLMSTNKGRRGIKSAKMTHVDESGQIRMVDVGDKATTRRTAVASGFVRMAAETAKAGKAHRTPKGHPIESARLAGILAAKKTHAPIPLSHCLPAQTVDSS